MNKLSALCALILLCSVKFFAQGNYVEENKIPSEVKPFIERNTKVLALESSDLNGDGKSDYVLVLEKQDLDPEGNPLEVGQRPLILLIRNENNVLYAAKRNENLILCSTCGGVWGDPFQGVKVGLKTFTINHYGGSNYRWTSDYKYNYSKIDNTWQLVKVVESDFNTFTPNKQHTTVYTPPKNFGKIDISESFDTSKFKKTGKKR